MISLLVLTLDKDLATHGLTNYYNKLKNDKIFSKKIFISLLVLLITYLQVLGTNQINLSPIQAM